MGSARRDAILKAADRLFRHYGHAKTTIADIAHEADVGVGTVYLEFASKEAILEELALGAYARVLDAMRNALASERRETHALWFAVLDARVTAYFEVVESGQHACELVHCRAFGVQAAAARFEQEERALFEHLLARIAPTTNAPEAAALVQLAYAKLSPPHVFDLDRREALRISRALASLLLEGVLPRPHKSAQRSK